jgi:hypothetical protein
MPPYNLAKTGLVSAPQQAVPGLPAYCFGSLNRNVAPTIMAVTAVQLTSPTAQVTGTVIEGQIPVVGQLVSIAGAVPSYFNVTNAKITAVSAAATPDIGVYTISFALTNSNIGTTNSPGKAIAPQIEIGDTLAINNGTTATANASASASVAIQENINPANGKSIRADVTFPTKPGAATVALQTSVLDIDSEFTTLGTVASVTGGVVSGQTVIFANVEALFFRFLVTGLAGTGTVVAKGTI